jgi:hypothetical protein
MTTLNVKIENAIAPLIDLCQRHADQLERKIIEWAGSNLSPAQSNDLIDIVRKLQSAPDFRNDLATLAMNLTQPIINGGLPT